MKYKFQNCDGDNFPETYSTLKEALSECSDYKSFCCKEGDVYHTREHGMVYPVEVKN